MTRIIWRFYSPIARKGLAIGFPTMELDESQLNILWTIGKVGPKSYYELQKLKYTLPNKFRGKPFCSNNKAWMQKAGKLVSYHYPFIMKIVQRLQEKGLVETHRDTSGNRIKKIVEPTFSGLMLYLQNSEQDFEDLPKNYLKFFPFYEQWNSIKKEFGRQKCSKALENAIMSFVEVQRCKFRIRPLETEFEGFLKTPDEFKFIGESKEDVEVIRERDKEVASFLETEEAILLRNSYIGYLGTKDIKLLSSSNEENTKELLLNVISEQELAYFEKRKIGSNSLFNGKRLKEFYPKYARIEYFFTGMFVENLLWNRKTETVQEAREAKIPDFEVESLY